MLDVDFLLQRPAVDRPLIYLYRSGALRHRVRAAFTDSMKERGLTFGHFTPAELGAVLQRVGFFLPDAMLCEWDIEPSRTPEAANLALSALAECRDVNCAVFASRRSAMTKSAKWPAIVSNALILEEPIVAADTLPNMIRFAQSEALLDIPDNFLSRQSTLDAFDDLIESGCAGFLEAKYRLIEVALAHFCQEAGDGSPFETDRTVARRADEAGFRMLRNLTGSPSETSAREFVMAIEERILTGSATQPIISRAYRWTMRLLNAISSTRQSTSRGFDPGILPKTVLIWAALLSAWEDCLRDSSQRRSFARRRDPDMQMIEWDRLVREFLARSCLSDAEDPLVDCWARLRERVHAARGENLDVIAKSGHEMLSSLRGCLGSGETDIASPWGERLHSLLQRLPAELDDE